MDIQDVLESVKKSADKPSSSSSGASPAMGSSLDPTEKKLSRLRKKLKQIEDLKAKRDKGEQLETNQVIGIGYSCGLNYYVMVGYSE